MPKEVYDRKHAFLPRSALLSFAEITRLAGVFAGAGVRKVRLTGGEPLLRKNLERLVEMLAAVRTPEGELLDVTLTTNGSILGIKAGALRAAGLKRLTVSLDAIDDAVFRRMNDVNFAVEDVLTGIDAAIVTGFAPVKVNMVVKRGKNDGQIIPLTRALHARYGNAVVLRFIEFMDVGSTNNWRLDDVIPSSDVLARLGQIGPLTALPATVEGETARRWRFDTTGQEIGLVSSVTHAFCGSCNRARLSATGKLYLCLFATHGHDLRALLQGGANDAAIAAAIGHLWSGRDDQYSAQRSAAASSFDRRGTTTQERRVEMHYIGG